MNLSLDLNKRLVTRMDEMAEAIQRSRLWIAEQAIEQYLAHQDWMDKKTVEAIDDIEAGARLIDHADVSKQQSRNE